MNKTEQQFFALLRSGLWNNTIDEDLFKDSVDWEAIFKIATMQTVCGVLYDGISQLSVDLQPPPTLMRQLYKTVIRIEQSHELLNTQLIEIVPKLQSESSDPLILLKGQGVAQNYPNPIRRQCGDIDLFIGKKYYERLCGVLYHLDIDPEDKSRKKDNKHKNYYLNGVNIELHILIERMWNPIYDRRFQKWVDSQLQEDRLRIWNLNGVDVFLPPVNFDSLFIFYHAYHHFISGGIGLRQLCDWIIYLHTFKNQINKVELKRDLETLGLMEKWQIFGSMAVIQLGLPKEEFPFYVDKYEKLSSGLLSKILQSGNFGFYYGELKEYPSSLALTKFRSFLLRQKWLLEISSISKKEILIYYIWYLRSGITNLIKGH